jgi:5-methylcytosine-specific restriction endonuclease McrA
MPPRGRTEGTWRVGDTLESDDGTAFVSYYVYPDYERMYEVIGAIDGMEPHGPFLHPDNGGQVIYVGVVSRPGPGTPSPGSFVQVMRKIQALGLPVYADIVNEKLLELSRRFTAGLWESPSQFQIPHSVEQAFVKAMECPMCHSNLLLNQPPPKSDEKVYCPVCGWTPRTAAYRTSALPFRGDLMRAVNQAGYMVYHQFHSGTPEYHQKLLEKYPEQTNPNYDEWEQERFERDVPWGGPEQWENRYPEWEARQNVDWDNPNALAPEDESKNKIMDLQYGEKPKTLVDRAQGLTEALKNFPPMNIEGDLQRAVYRAFLEVYMAVPERAYDELFRAGLNEEEIQFVIADIQKHVDGWRQRASKTATTTRKKLLEQKAEMDAVLPEKGEKHDLGNGYHIYHPGTWYDTAREGTLMENCTSDEGCHELQRAVQEGKQDPAWTYDKPYSDPNNPMDYWAPAYLRDNEGIPHAMWTHYFNDGRGNPVPGSEQATDAEGRRGQPLKDEYIQMLHQYYAPDVPYEDYRERYAKITAFDAPLENPINYHWVPWTDQELATWEQSPDQQTWQARARSVNRGARKRGYAGTITGRDIFLLTKRYQGTCAYCGRPGADSWDHVIPLSEGGENMADNLLPAHQQCNSDLNNLQTRNQDYRSPSLEQMSPNWLMQPAEAKTSAVMYHISGPHNRESILEHGLNWEKSDPRSRLENNDVNPNAEEWPRGNYLFTSYDQADLGGEDDIYEVNVDGLNLQEDPYGEGPNPHAVWTPRSYWPRAT